MCNISNSGGILYVLPLTGQTGYDKKKSLKAKPKWIFNA